MAIKQQFLNSMEIIKQIKAGEWEFTGQHKYIFEADFTCYTANRNGIQLWVANGALHCEIRDKPWELGIFGMLVYIFAARKKKAQIERKMRRKATDLTN